MPSSFRTFRVPKTVFSLHLGVLFQGFQVTYNSKAACFGYLNLIKEYIIGSRVVFLIQRKKPRKTRQLYGLPPVTLITHSRAVSNKNVLVYCRLRAKEEELWTMRAMAMEKAATTITFRPRKTGWDSTTSAYSTQTSTQDQVSVEAHWPMETDLQIKLQRDTFLTCFLLRAIFLSCWYYSCETWFYLSWR